LIGKLIEIHLMLRKYVAKYRDRSGS